LSPEIIEKTTGTTGTGLDISLFTSKEQTLHVGVVEEKLNNIVTNEYSSDKH
jgi:hypothetical protein